MLAQALHLKDGRIEAVARGYAVPLIVSLPGMDPGFVVVPSRAGIEHFFRLKHAGLEAAGVAYLRVRVVQTRATGPDRITARAEWYYLTSDGSSAGQTSARYFLERRQGAIQVAMVEFEQVAFPQLADWFWEAAEPSFRTPPRRVQ